MTEFYVGIPLRAKSTTDDWQTVERNLRRTLMCLLSQVDASPRVLIAGHDKPEFLDELKDRVQFIDVSQAFDPPTHVKGTGGDKGRKKDHIGHAIRTQVDGPVYYMHMDADDLIEERFVMRVLRDNNKKGYLITRGYVVDVANGRLARSDETNLPFYRHCGSCAVMYFEPEELPAAPDDSSSIYSAFRSHADYAKISRRHGRPLRQLSRYAGAYLINHGENVRRYRGVGENKEKFVDRHLVTDQAEIDAACRHFRGLSEILRGAQKSA